MKYIIYLASLILISFSSEAGVINEKKSFIANAVPPALFGVEVAPHPRLLFSALDEEKALKEHSKDLIFQGLLVELKEKADSLLGLPLLLAPNNLSKSREHVYRIITLSLAYRLFDETKYFEEAVSNVVNVCKFPSWNSHHYLDVAETTTAVAIGYDWLYEDLSEAHRRLIVQAIEDKALKVALPVYREVGNDGAWAKRETNWNVVCNTGMIMGAFAIAESNPVLAEEIIGHAVKYPVNCLKHYAPDGVCYEGPGYWEYTNIYLAIMLNALEDNVGHSFGIAELEGISETANYYINTLSPSKKVFNFANSSAAGNDEQLSSNYSPFFSYFSKRWQQPKVAGYYHEQLGEIISKQAITPKWHFFLSIPWFDGDIEEEWRDRAKVSVFQNEYNPIVVLRGGTDQPDKDIFLSAKGGAPNQAHQQMDVGHFIIESQGIRWLEDLGSDHYNLPGFWDYGPKGQRWSYFRNTNFSHNTLAIDDSVQYAGGRGFIEKFRNDTTYPFAVINLTSAYGKQAQSVLRKMKLLGHDLILVQDDVKLESHRQRVTWSSITSAEVEVRRNIAVLNKDGQQFFLKIISPGMVFSVEEARTYTDVEKPLSGYKLLKVNAEPSEDKEVRIQIVMGSEKDKLDQVKVAQAAL